jgi:hypothetical protein
MATKILKGAKVVVRAGAELWRPVTAAEVQAWRDGPDSKGMTDGGETKLPPTHTFRYADGGDTYRVNRARVSATRSYRTVSGCALVYDNEGVLWSVYRDNLAFLEA